MGFDLAHALRMSVRDVLAANFKKLRDATPSLNRPRDIVQAGAATNGTIGRISKKETGPSVDTIEQLAAAYGIEAWQMLVPTLQAAPGKDGSPIITGLPIYPDATAVGSRGQLSHDALDAAVMVNQLKSAEDRELVLEMIRKVVLAQTQRSLI